jgi:nucleoside-diphosphate-sugar epimerase
MKRVIITGASGFIGANVVRRLLRDGHEVHVLVRPDFKSWRLEEIASDIRFHQTDLRDSAGVSSVVHTVRPDWVFHLAAYGSYPSQTDVERMITTNLMGCASLLNACADNGLEAFVQTGSSSEYGYKDHLAQEHERLEPNSHYAITKAAATHYCQFTARQRNINAVTLRLYSVYGPYEEPTRLIPALITYGLRGQLPPLVSKQTARDFVYVDEAVEAMLQVALSASIPRGAVYNVCTGVQTSLEDVVAIARKRLCITAEPCWSTMNARSWDTVVWVGSAAMIGCAVGWQAKLGFEEGLHQTIEWYQRNPQWQQFYSARILADRSGG